MRTLGFLLLGIGVGAVLRLHELVLLPPRHEPTLPEFLFGVLVVVCGCVGAAMAVLGRKLLEKVPVPARSWHRVSWDDE